MSGHGSEGSPPPEVPDEFAAAYRAAYERALAESAEEAAAGRRPGTPSSALPDEDYPAVPPQHVTSVGSHRAAHGGGRHPVEEREGSGPVPAGLGPEHAIESTGSDHAAGSRWEEWTRRPWFVPTLLLVVLVLVLVLAAYALGRIVSGDVKDTKGPSATPSVVLSESGGSSPSSAPSKKPSKKPSPTHVWQGAVHPTAIQDAQATCTSRPGVDSSGHPVRYDASNTIDKDDSTAWRCDGTAVGERLVFRLPGKTSIGRVALVPGYAKTDPKSGADRYAENNRVTRVRWILGDTSVEQTMSGDPANRSLRMLRIPKTATDRVVLEILAVKRGPRDTTAISTVKLAATG